MIDPFTFWFRTVSAALDMMATAQRGTEMLDASHHVMAKRTAMMNDAARSPLHGNYAELNRMVPEKIEAFGKASTAMAGDWWAMQSELIAQFRHAAAMATKGRLPTFSELTGFSSRNAMLSLRIFEHASAMGDKGMRPLHASAMANARRLKRSAS